MNARIPMLALAILYLLFFAVLVLTAGKLPDPVASHFDGRGVPDAWTSRGNYLTLLAAMAMFLPGIVVALCYVVRFLPVSMINLPHREYWLAPERRAATDLYLFRQSLWFACAAVLFLIAVHFTVIDANSKIPPRLSNPLLILSAGGFLVAVVAWIIKLLWPFLKDPPPAPTAGLDSAHKNR